MNGRRGFLKALAAILFFPARALARESAGKAGDLHGFGVSVDKCIGCGRCMDACKAENNVPREPFFVRTWVERYILRKDGRTTVSTIAPGEGGNFDPPLDKSILRAFFVPKLCNQCEKPPCVQVCPVGATYRTKDGVVLVNPSTCIGCRYCIQACPYGARYLHPATRTADKCTFCYHRVGRNLLPACVEVCPTQARIFGNLNATASPMTRFLRMNKIHVLKPALNTEPKVYYAGLDGEVR